MFAPLASSAPMEMESLGGITSAVEERRLQLNSDGGIFTLVKIFLLEK